MTPDETQEIMRHLGVIAEDLRSDIRLVAEGVAMNTERLDRQEKELRTFREETNRNFTELRAAINLSHGELDRRVTAMERG